MSYIDVHILLYLQIHLATWLRSQYVYLTRYNHLEAILLPIAVLCKTFWFYLHCHLQAHKKYVHSLALDGLKVDKGSPRVIMCTC